MAGAASSFGRVNWKYDAMGRRVRQRFYVLSNGVWQVVENLKFVSDPELFGRHIAELNATNNAPVRAYIWGLDLSETLDGAGGVGGLLRVRVATGAAPGTHFVSYDGNGNLWNLVSASTGTETARYEYGPFGEPLRLSGPAVKANPFRFSTERTEEFTGLILYEYRPYSPTSGRWLSKDPIGEASFRRTWLGGARTNVLGDVAFCANDAIQGHDVLDLAWNAVKCQQWCDDAVRFCNLWSRKRALEFCYACCLDAMGDAREGKACVMATAGACLCVRKPPWRS